MASGSPILVALATFLAACSCAEPGGERAGVAASARAPEPVCEACEAGPRRSAAAVKNWSREDLADIAELTSAYKTARAPEPPPQTPASGTTSGTTSGTSEKAGASLVGHPLPATRFLDADGVVIDLDDWIGKKNVVLVIHRGFSGSVCMTCTSQTLAITQNLKAFAERHAQVFFVYPGRRDGVGKFLDAVNEARGSNESLPIDVLLDTDLSLVRKLGIEADLARPTTLILDRTGVIRFAHVAPNITDRASVPTMLDALARLETVR